MSSKILIYPLIRLENFVQIRQVIEEELALSWSEANKTAEQALNDSVNRASIFLTE